MKTYKEYLIGQLKNPGFWLAEIFLIVLFFNHQNSFGVLILNTLICLALPFIFALSKYLHDSAEDTEIVKEYKAGQKLPEPNELMDKYVSPSVDVLSLKSGETVYAPIGCAENKVYRKYEDCRKAVLKEVERRQKVDDEHIAEVEIYATHPELILYKKWHELHKDWWTNGQSEVYIIEFKVV